ncbi:MAG: N-acyl homoserine lactonase family protein [Lachnospiraceae bacterium]|nr:N-acyl homoserine lactonase family protein [Lachnospiraceae bacterium]
MKKTDATKVRLLYLGAMECAKYRMICTENREEKIRIPITALLICHPELGNIVYDTGVGADWREVLPKETLRNFPVVDFRSLPEALAEEGLTPGDISLVIMSHLHFDHAGDLRCFAGTPAGEHILVGRAEYERAEEVVRTGVGSGYVGVHFQHPGLHFEFVEKDRVLAENLCIFVQTSHSPALLGLEIGRAGRPPLLCVSDAVYTRENYERELPPDSPNPANNAGFLKNLQRLKVRQRETGAEILFGHDWEQMEAWRKLADR